MSTRSLRRNALASFRIESLEDRTSPSGIGVGHAVASLHRHGAVRVHDVSTARHGKDDAPGHDINDDKGIHRAGKDDAPGRNINDDKGVHRAGKDDAPGHDINDDKGIHGGGHR